jgi:hypothetical protein
MKEFISNYIDNLYNSFKNNETTNRLREMGDLNLYTPISHFNKTETIHSLFCDTVLENVL